MGGNRALGRLRNPFTDLGPAEPMLGQGMGYGAPGAMGAPGGGTSPYGAGAEGGAMGSGTGAPGAPGSTAGAGAPGTAGAGDLFSAEGTAGPGFGGGAGATSDVFNMIGDQNSFGAALSLPGQPRPPRVPGIRGGYLYPTVRNFKIAENQSPRPTDRLFFDFNYYNNLGAAVNRRIDSPLSQVKGYRYLLGLEKTFNEGMGSIGFRLPIDSLTADVGSLAVPATSQSLGDLSIFGKYILAQNVQTGSLLSGGLMITPPTGPKTFANAAYLNAIHSFYFQPYLGWIVNRGRFYMQGFFSFDFPTNNSAVSMIYNDIGFGYFLLRNNDPTAFLTAVAPTFEVHVNNPLNHRDPFSKFDLSGTGDAVNLTYGLNFEFGRRSLLTFAFVTPVASPKPFDTELILFYNFRFGRSVRSMIPATPPVIGQ